MVGGKTPRPLSYFYFGARRMREIKVKICGVTNLADRDTVIAAGADYFGAIIEVPQSPRSIELHQAAIIFNTKEIGRVAVLVNPQENFLFRVVERLQPTAVQLHGEELPEFTANIREKIGCELWKVLKVPAEIAKKEEMIKELKAKITAYMQAGIRTILLDTQVKMKSGEQAGGTGRSFEWAIIRELALPSEVKLFVAGGINPENVMGLLQEAEINGIDVSSGVELFPGKKDPIKIRKLMAEVRRMLTAP